MQKPKPQRGTNRHDSSAETRESSRGARQAGNGLKGNRFVSRVLARLGHGDTPKWQVETTNPNEQEHTDIF